MNEVIGAKPPSWFWIVATLGVLWEGFGVATYLMHVGILPTDPGAMSEAERALMDATPVWATAAYAIAVFGGLLGAVGLLLRKAWSRALLIVSLVAILVQFTWWVFLSGALEVIGTSVFIMPAVIILAGALLVWLAGTAMKRGWVA